MKLKKPFLLMSHLDVVPANPDEWDEPPFSGKIKDGYIWGRGALDCKGVALAHLMVFLLLKRNDISLNRDIIFLTAADEENLGLKGMEWLVKNHYDLIEAEFALNEGGGISIKSSRDQLWEISSFL